MTEAEATPAEERLPWLGEDAERPRDHRTRDAIGLAVVAALLIFGVSYWIASQSWQRARDVADNGAASPPAAARLPDAPPAARKDRSNRVAVDRRAGHQVATRGRAGPSTAPASTVASRAVAQRLAPPVAAPAARAVAQRQAPASTAPAKAPQVAARTAAPARKGPTTSEVIKAVADAQPAKVTRAPKAAAQKVAIASAGPAPGRGRVVRVGAFASPIEARLGWRSMVRAYPVLAHLPASVVDASGSRARPSYRFEIGTSPQVDPATLCARMSRINFSCAVASR